MGIDIWYFCHDILRYDFMLSVDANAYFTGCSVSLAAILRGHNWVHFAHRLLVYCYLEFKLHYPKNLKLFSIKLVKELFEPLVLQKKPTCFCSF